MVGAVRFSTDRVVVIVDDAPGETAQDWPGERCRGCRVRLLDVGEVAPGLCCDCFERREQQRERQRERRRQQSEAAAAAEEE